MALDGYVQRTQNSQGRGRGGWRGRERGRGRENFNENRNQTKPTGRGSLGMIPKGSAFLRIGLKSNGDPTDHNGIASSDLRDKIATKVKANMIDLREKLPPKALPPTKTKPFPKKLLQPPLPPPPFPRNARAPPGNRVPSHYAPVQPTTAAAAAHGQPYILPQTRPIPRSPPSPPKYYLPSEAEARKITVTVPGLSKTTSEVRWTF